MVAEKIMGIVPEGTHQWEKFVPPEELGRLLESREFPEDGGSAERYPYVRCRTGEGIS